MMLKRWWFALGTVGLVVGVVSPSSGSILAGQAKGSAQGLGAALKTAWAEPDLQGIWMHDEETPLQRPLWVKGREFFTDEELQKLDKRRASKLDHDYRVAG